ncbi:hypothetical protein J1N35_038633 [Gossypium stocksii]|uniref:Reverse transcriptase n=1 Tax=Gossypium stocksii TaxID=47602 RepID=A0A9D3UP84_9ROSI|nr:hypothetical protein J1N35_038633 [Gossypium stocksii]
MRMKWNDQCNNDNLFRFEAKLCLESSFKEFRGRISELDDENGRRTSSTEEFLKLTSEYFSNLFSASDVGSNEHLFGLAEKRVTDSMSDDLLKQFTEEEIGYAVKMMAHLKSSGVDGSPQYFSKSRKAKKLSQFRPISLCNVVYKIIAKVLVNRMSAILGNCINEAQGAFILRRLISDNVLIAYEVFHFLKMKNRGFSTLINEAKQKGLMRGAPIGRERFSINHLFFADDCMLFVDALCEGARMV